MLMPQLRAVKQIRFNPNLSFVEPVIDGTILTLVLAQCANQLHPARKALAYVRSLLILVGFDNQPKKAEFGPQNGAVVSWNEDQGEIGVSVSSWSPAACQLFREIVLQTARLHDWEVNEQSQASSPPVDQYLSVDNEPVIRDETRGRWEFVHNPKTKDRRYLHMDCDALVDDRGYCLMCGAPNPALWSEIGELS